jgi:hypothetical protein
MSYNIGPVFTITIRMAKDMRITVSIGHLLVHKITVDGAV